jgi:hypothetical protein
MHSNPSQNSLVGRGLADANAGLFWTFGTHGSVAEETVAAKILTHEKIEVADRVTVAWDLLHGFGQHTADSLLPC